MLLLCVLLAWRFASVPILTVGGAAFLVGLYALRALLRQRVGNWANLLQDPRSALRVPVQNWFGALALTSIARFILRFIDPAYVTAGRLEKHGLAAALGVVALPAAPDWRALAELPWIYATSSTCRSPAAEALFKLHQRPRPLSGGGPRAT